jgi:hypothetical protein
MTQKRTARYQQKSSIYLFSPEFNGPLERGTHSKKLRLEENSDGRMISVLKKASSVFSGRKHMAKSTPITAIYASSFKTPRDTSKSKLLSQLKPVTTAQKQFLFETSRCYMLL